MLTLEFSYSSSWSATDNQTPEEENLNFVFQIQNGTLNKILLGVGVVHGCNGTPGNGTRNTERKESNPKGMHTLCNKKPVCSGSLFRPSQKP